MDPARVLADLDELHALTGDDEAGASRVAWTDGWSRARRWLEGRLEGIDGVAVETDAAGNLWASRPSPAGGPRVAVGSHLDSVPAGGRLDGALGVLAALEVLRGADGDVVLVDWADEEGARFGHSLLGSSAAAGLLDLEAVLALRDADGVLLPDAMAACGARLDAPPDGRLAALDAYLELHIEQGPVLETRGDAVAAVTGCLGVERHRLRFTGRGGHAGTLPMRGRDDPLVAAARVAAALPEIAERLGGVGTVGGIEASPGIPTAVPGSAVAWLDLRHADAGALAAMLAEVRAVAGGAEVDPVFRLEPVAFDPRLVALAAEACGGTEPLPSGALHDAAAVARAGVPTAMIFVQSRGGISHAPDESSAPDHVAEGVRALGRTVAAALRA